MNGERIQLHREQETMLMTLYLHARDAQSTHPILDDPYAVSALGRIDYDFTRFAPLAGNLPLILGRAKAIDDISRAFLADHSDAVVLHLGCGLDSRVLRLDPGPGVAWFDVDQPPVIDLRRRIVDERAGVTTVPTSVTESQWWSSIPVGRPTLVIGEGLLMYLDPDGVRTLIDAILAHGPTTQQTLVFDTVAPWLRRISAWQTNFRKADTKFLSTTAALDAVAAGHDDLHLSEERSLVALARQSAPGLLGKLIAAVDAVGAGHRALLLRTYDYQPGATSTAV